MIILSCVYDRLQHVMFLEQMIFIFAILVLIFLLIFSVSYSFIFSFVNILFLI